MTKRIELCIFNKKDIDSFFSFSKKYNIVNVYIKVSLKTLSDTRKRLIEQNYTTRLFIVLNNGIKEEYIYGKLKGSKGVFNEHCKNSVYRAAIQNVVGISSNDNDAILIDDENIKDNYVEPREWIQV